MTIHNRRTVDKTDTVDEHKLANWDVRYGDEEWKYGRRSAFAKWRDQRARKDRTKK